MVKYLGGKKSPQSYKLKITASRTPTNKKEMRLFCPLQIASECENWERECATWPATDYYEKTGCFFPFSRKLWSELKQTIQSWCVRGCVCFSCKLNVVISRKITLSELDDCIYPEIIVMQAKSRERENFIFPIRKIATTYTANRIWMQWEKKREERSRYQIKRNITKTYKW